MLTNKEKTARRISPVRRPSMILGFVLEEERHQLDVRSNSPKTITANQAWLLIRLLHHCPHITPLEPHRPETS
jgi:hypothetical protein